MKLASLLPVSPILSWGHWGHSHRSSHRARDWSIKDTVRDGLDAKIKVLLSARHGWAILPLLARVWDALCIHNVRSVVRDTLMAHCTDVSLSFAFFFFLVVLWFHVRPMCLRQAFYHLSHTLSPFFLFFFFAFSYISGQVSCFCLGLAWWDLPRWSSYLWLPT
jgi:hypothetical protein